MAAQMMSFALVGILADRSRDYCAMYVAHSASFLAFLLFNHLSFTYPSLHLLSGQNCFHKTGSLMRSLIEEQAINKSPSCRPAAAPKCNHFANSHLHTRPLSFTRTLRLKEDKPQDGHELEKAKQQQHTSEQQRDELASSSESAVKADQNKQDVESLQKETAKQSQKEHAHGKS
ncbi:uncharacterized protein MYCFIDRAFT_169774 [Pseudocercospora fijiensis CIRAD86]|uniref:Uncharacterized protein n=1 Tax=Pseudocercospora fijiensis (strain CIRAD86) TaxID=383855 RepID=N1Q6L5_PSEFD|nr:uncharacterized protein MYCFIDRAFT_169774 [Pseudocercospora fijiensis CIRAD86]EME88074.1 hypothetical protein MYCFIDRAFT_169774 [Pseudocercospora fijiensis CIRAD86]